MSREVRIPGLFVVVVAVVALGLGAAALGASVAGHNGWPGGMMNGGHGYGGPGSYSTYGNGYGPGMMGGGNSNVGAQPGAAGLCRRNPSFAPDRPRDRRAGLQL